MSGKFGLDPHRLDDEALERELRYLYATREETFFHGTRQALLNHTERMLQLEREYANRFPERTKADALRTRKGARLQDIAALTLARDLRDLRPGQRSAAYRPRVSPLGMGTCRQSPVTPTTTNRRIYVYPAEHDEPAEAY
jgi:hypothetical protein